MNTIKKNFYPIFGTLFLLLVLAIVFFNKETENPIPKLKERVGKIAIGSEWLNTKKAIEGLLDEIRKNPENYKAKLQLAQAYLQEARVTGDQYYETSALDLLSTILKKDPQNFEALCSQATIYLSQHHFSQALEVAKKALTINQDNSFVYGLLTDANVELGNYNEAIKYLDIMSTKRPDIKSYSRVSYLREIYGDYEGSISAMKLALHAGFPGLEQTAWVQVQLGNLYLNTGEMKKAEEEYQRCLFYRPNYAFAYAGLAEVEFAKKNYDQAINLLQQARNILPIYGFSEQMTDIYLASNQKLKADSSIAHAIELLEESADNANENKGHYADKELAIAYLKAGDLDKALSHAKIEYDRRPKNIDVNEVMAWVLYKRNEFKEANIYVDVALKTNSQKAITLMLSGLIKTKMGDAQNGIVSIKKALSVNPFLTSPLVKDAKLILVQNNKQEIINIPTSLKK